MRNFLFLLASLTSYFVALPSYAVEFCNFPSPKPIEGEIAKVGQAMDSDRERFKVDKPLNGRVIEVGGISSSLTASVVRGSDNIFSEVHEKRGSSLNAGIKDKDIGSGLFNLKKSREFTRKVTQNNYASTFMLRFDVKLPNEQFEIDSSSGSPLTSYAQSLLNDPCKFKQIFGDSFVFQTQRGASVYVAISVAFSSFDAQSDYKKNMEAGVDASFKGFEGCVGCSQIPIKIPAFSLKAAFDKSKQNTNQVTINSGRVEIIAMQEGGDASRLGQIFGTGGDIPLTSCSLNDLSSCDKAFNNVLAYLAQEEFANGVKRYPTVLKYLFRPYWEVDPSIQLVNEVTPAIETARNNLALALLNQEAGLETVKNILVSSPLLTPSIAEADRQYLTNLKTKLEQDIEKLIATGLTCFDNLANCESIASQVLGSLTTFNSLALQSYMTDGLIAHFPFDLPHQSFQKLADSRPFSAQLFPLPNFQGIAQIITEDKPSLVPDNLVASVKLPANCMVVLYDSPGYVDQAVNNDVYWISSNNADLSRPNHIGWNNKASSAKFSCSTLSNMSTSGTGEYKGAVYGAGLTADRTGSQSSAYQFNVNFIDIPSNLIAPYMSIGAWVKPDNNNVSSIVTRFTHASNPQYALRQDGNEVGFYIRRTASGLCSPGGWYKIGGGAQLEIGKWSFVVGTWDGNTMRIYVNGKLKNSRSDLPPGGIDHCFGTAATLVGGNENSTEFFSGAIDDFVFYNRSLSDKEIQQLYTGKSANQPPVAQFIATPTQGNAPLTVNLDASTSNDSDGSIQNYQWKSSDGQTATGKNSYLVFGKIGTYTITLTVTDNEGLTSTTQQTVTVQNTTIQPGSTNRLGGISTRSYVGTDPANYMIAGLFVNTTAKKVVARASSVDGILNPKLSIKTYPAGTVIYSNNDWVTGTSATELQQKKWSPVNPTDAALIVTLQPGLYTVEVSPESVAGVGIVEVYELDSIGKLGGISTRSYVDSNPMNYMIAGVLVQGDPKRLIVRAVSVDGIFDPKIDIKTYPAGTTIHSNTDWATGSSATELQQLKWNPPGAKDAALSITLSPGLYTMEVSPQNGVAGVGLVEVYEHPTALGNGN